MDAGTSAGSRIAPGRGVVKLNDSTGDPGGCQKTESLSRVAVGGELAQLRHGALNGAAQRILQQAAELHQRCAKFGVVSSGELCEESRGKHHRDRLVFTKAQLWQQPLLRYAPTAEVVPDRHADACFERLEVAIGGAATDAELLGEVLGSDPRLAGGLDIAQGAQESGAPIALLEVGVALRRVGTHGSDCATPPPVGSTPQI